MMRAFNHKTVSAESTVRPAAGRTAAHDQAVIEKLVDKAAAGNFEAFGKIYGIYLDQIYRYVFYQVRDKMTAEDVTEEVFIKAWQAIASCKGKGRTFSAWLYRIAHNHMINTLRNAQKSVSIEQGNMTGLRDNKLEIEKRLEHQELLELVDYLPENQRQVIILKFITGLNNREIAAVMHKKEGAVRILQMRALMALRQKLDSGKNEQV